MNYLSELAQSLEPYVPGEQPKDKKYIKLNTNENPYPPSGSVMEAVRREAENLPSVSGSGCHGSPECSCTVL